MGEQSHSRIIVPSIERLAGACDALISISKNLSEINKRVTKYLDNIEADKQPESNVSHPVICSRCDREIQPGMLYAWSDDTLPVCYSCASPSEASNACAALILRQPLELKIDGPPITTCASCFSEIPESADAMCHHCEHGWFCSSCGSCDECRSA